MSQAKPDSQSFLSLSTRGQHSAQHNDLDLIFKLVRDNWHPEDNKDGWVNLGLAENDIMHEKLTAYMEKTFSVPRILLTYNDGGAGSRKLGATVARFLTRRLKPVIPFISEHVVATNGCSAALDAVSYVLGNPGDGFLLGRPYYRAFIPDFETRPLSKVISVSFGSLDPMSVEAVKCYEDTIKQSQSEGQPIRAIVLCHPHNPLGRCYPKEALIEYMKLCQQYHIHLISDEIYALSIWTNTEDTHPPPTPFTSVAAIDTTNLIDPHLIHILWGMSKDFGANGLRIGFILSQANKPFINALQTLSLYTYPSTIADNITATILADDAFTEAYTAENNEALSQRYAVATWYLGIHGIAYAPGANAAFFVLADLGAAYRRHHPTLGPDEDVVQVLIDKLAAKKVFIVDSNAIGSETPGWFRIVFSQYEAYLIEGLRRIVEVVKGTGDDVPVGNGEGVKTSETLPLREKVGDGMENPQEALVS